MPDNPMLAVYVLGAWVEYVLPNPTNWAEIGKVLTQLTQELGEERARWGDVVEVIGGDEEIVFRYVKEADRG